MKSIKKLLLVLLAMLATFAFMSCKDDDDDEDKPVTITFTLVEDKTYTQLDETTYIFESHPTKIDGDEVTFFLWMSDFSQIGTGSNSTGTWMFGVENEDEETEEIDTDIPLIGLYKGTFVDNSKATVLNRTHIIDSEGEWIESAKPIWKSISIASGTKYFRLTLTESDIAELEKNFSDEE